MKERGEIRTPGRSLARLAASARVGQEQVEEVALGIALRHEHWCPGDDEQPAHGWGHQLAECFTQEPALRAGAETCPGCFSHLDVFAQEEVGSWDGLV